MTNKSDIQQAKQRFGIIGNSAELNRAIERALMVAPTDMSVLITGESGVGKESFPQIIHQNSLRKHGTYIAVNCGSIPEGTIDSELFGHEKGSFTGATGERKGYFEVANGGTLFLDEAGELPLSTQARLLRVLESGEYMKVGSSKVEKTNVRVVAATNVNMVEAVNKGKFREDLYYRLNTVPIYIPPLRERKEDIVLLFRKFASDFADKYRMPPIVLTDSAKETLARYRWPGNIRQLKNITEQISIMEQVREISSEVLQSYLPEQESGMITSMVTTRGSSEHKDFSSEREILYQVLFDMKKDMTELKKIVHRLVHEANLSVDDFSSDIAKEMITPSTMSKISRLPISIGYEDISDVDSLASEEHDFKESTSQEHTQEAPAVTLEEVEKSMIIKALHRHEGKRKQAAKELGISERTLYRKIKEYNLED